MSLNNIIPNAGGSYITLVLDKSGRIAFDHQVVTQNYQLEMANGTRYQIEAYSNPEQGKLANRGFHNHTSQVDAAINSPASHTEHRNLYAELLDGPSDKEDS